jgi:hypothetical protein
MISDQTLRGIPAVRLGPALPRDEQIALGDALGEWRRRLWRKLSPLEYQRCVIRHVRIVTDPGSSL